MLINQGWLRDGIFPGSGFGIFNLRDRYFFRGLWYPDKKPTLLINRFTLLFITRLIFKIKMTIRFEAYKIQMNFRIFSDLDYDEFFQIF